LRFFDFLEENKTDLSSAFYQHSRFLWVVDRPDHIKGYTADELTQRSNKRAKRKYEHIEYAQTADRSSNFIGFSDNFIYYLTHTFTWNPRIPL
jgi:hypothetical protein